MSDDELINEFFKTSVKGETVIISVKRITWDSPYEPKSRWRKAATLPAAATEQEIAAKIRELLTDERFFQICADCHERNPVGWLTGTCCHSCCEKNHGIVY